MKFKFCCLQRTPQELLENSHKFPVIECLSSGGQPRLDGMTTVFVARQIVDGRYLFGVYMLDLYCLGVKNTFCRVGIEREAFNEAKRLLTSRFHMEDLTYEDARSLILGAADYAMRFGFAPQEDWRESRFIVEAERPYSPKFEFGRNGEPFYIEGPDDNAAAIRRQLLIGKQQERQSVVAPQFSPIRT